MADPLGPEPDPLQDFPSRPVPPLPPAPARRGLWDDLPAVGEVVRLHLGPGDRLAVIYPRTLSARDAARLKERLAVVWPDVPVAIFDQGPELRVVGPDEP